MFGFHVALLLVLLPVCFLAPGFVLVRRLRWNPLETLCASIGLSLFLIYLATFTLYWLKVDLQWCWAVTGLCALLGALHARPLGRLLCDRQVRGPMQGFGFLLAWMLLLLALVRHYGAAGWADDWLEHFHRTMFFLKHLPVSTAIYPHYQLPARPPMMNLLATHFLAQTEFRFELFQIVFAFLNLLAFFPCCLMARALVRRGASGLLLLVGLLALNPMFIQNLMYSWTKLLAVFYVILGLWFYLAGWRRRDGVRTMAAFASFAVAALVHYSAGTYIVFVVGHYLVRVGRDFRARWREALAAVAVGAAILGTWFAWSLSVYGVTATFTSNTAAGGLREAPGLRAATIALNAFDTIVPHIFRNDLEILGRKFLEQRSALGYIRDYVFLMYQTNVIVAMGSVGGLVVLVRLLRATRGCPAVRCRLERRFWLLLAVVCTAVGVAVHGERETFGVAHVTLQPLVILGVTWLAASFRFLPRIVRCAVIAGCAFDFAAGIFLNVHLENFELDPRNPPGALFRVERTRDAAGRLQVKIDTDLSGTAGWNLISKYARGPMFGCAPPRHLEFLGDHVANFSGIFKGAVLGLAALVIVGMGREALRRKPGARGPPPGGLGAKKRA